MLVVVFALAHGLTYRREVHCRAGHADPAPVTLRSYGDGSAPGPRRGGSPKPVVEATWQPAGMGSRERFRTEPARPLLRGRFSPRSPPSRGPTVFKPADSPARRCQRPSIVCRAIRTPGPKFAPGHPGAWRSFEALCTRSVSPLRTPRRDLTKAMAMAPIFLFTRSKRAGPSSSSWLHDPAGQARFFHPGRNRLGGPSGLERQLDEWRSAHGIGHGNRLETGELFDQFLALRTRARACKNMRFAIRSTQPGYGVVMVRTGRRPGFSGPFFRYRRHCLSMHDLLFESFYLCVLDQGERLYSRRTHQRREGMRPGKTRRWSAGSGHLAGGSAREEGLEVKLVLSAPPRTNTALSGCFPQRIV